jgi:hypothetical protein
LDETYSAPVGIGIATAVETFLFRFRVNSWGELLLAFGRATKVTTGDGLESDPQPVNAIAIAAAASDIARFFISVLS